MTKPNLDLNVVAKIESVGSITNNMAEVQQKANAIREWYSNLVISEEDVKDMKKEKALINKLKDAVATYRKNIIAEFKKPIMDFENTAKETEKTLKEAYESIDSQISVFEEETRQKMVDELREYFREYADVNHLDWLEYERMNQKVNNSDSMKKLKNEISEFIGLVSSHLNAIETYPEEMRPDILVEYKSSLNFTDAVIKVSQRQKALDEEKARQEALKALKAKEEETVRKVDEVIAPVEVKEEKIYSTSFTVRGTIEQLKDLKRFLEERGIEYAAN